MDAQHKYCKLNVNYTNLVTLSQGFEQCMNPNYDGGVATGSDSASQVGANIDIIFTYWKCGIAQNNS